MEGKFIQNCRQDLRVQKAGKELNRLESGNQNEKARKLRWMHNSPSGNR